MTWVYWVSIVVAVTVALACIPVDLIGKRYGVRSELGLRVSIPLAAFALLGALLMVASLAQMDDESRHWLFGIGLFIAAMAGVYVLISLVRLRRQLRHA